VGSEWMKRCRLKVAAPSFSGTLYLASASALAIGQAAFNNSSR
jgi:hypothetical protein